MGVIIEAIAQITHEADRQLCEIYGIRNIESWGMLNAERKKEQIAMVAMMQAGSEMPAVSVDTELGKFRSRMMKSIVVALSEETDSCIRRNDNAGMTEEAESEEIDSGIRSKTRKTGMTNKSTKDTAKEGVNDGV
jgi:hypothetical protein